ncbi:hypothetical protein CDD80_3554 [Ophiocordyceps camponoti-rufipedis]|uniref:Uncharacterized protein n=1 Tax=Ophiocordyceps camponoti-rufipedis TaxID=2004952 RepID=A0A2C5YYG8_9HYPO|nr:hypothetical protein CDD80_3554 [Ophiocordyceps camponoti-rufipedis]
MLTTASTWATPLLSGLTSSLTPSNPPAAPFRLIAGLHLVSLPLLILCAPETVFDRSDSSDSDSDASTKASRGYIRNVIRFRPPLTSSSSSAARAVRAVVAPSTCLVSALSAVPYAALWGLAAVGAILVVPEPLELGPVVVGALLTGPWVLATLVVGGLACFYRGFHDRFTRRAGCVVVAVGAFLVVVGLLSFGLGLDNFMIKPVPSSPPYFTPSAAQQLSPPLLALQLGILAAGIHVLDTATRPLIARSASFSSSSVAAAQGSIGDMHAAIVAFRSFAAAIGIATLRASPLRPAVIAMTVVQILVVPAVLLLCWYAGEAVWRADGRVLRLVDARELKQSGSFFDHD